MFNWAAGMLKEEITLGELCAEIHLLCITLSYHFHKTKNYISQGTQLKLFSGNIWNNSAENHLNMFYQTLLYSSPVCISHYRHGYQFHQNS